VGDIYDIAPEHGACAGQSIEIWFPVTKKGGLNAQERQTRREHENLVLETCRGCEVRTHCLEYSLRHEPFGTWGGKTELERAEIRWKRGITLSREARINVPGRGSINANGSENMHLSHKESA